MNSQFIEHEKLCRSKSLKMQTLGLIAKMLGVLIHVDGMPYGSKRNCDFSDQETQGV